MLDAVYAAAGFLIGLAAGWLLRAIYQTRAMTREVRDMLTHHDPDRDTGRDTGRDDRGAANLDHARDIVVLVMLVVVIYTGVQSTRESNKISHQQHQLAAVQADRASEVRCLSTWAVGFGKALDARTAVSASTTDLRAKMDAASAEVFFHVAPVLVANPKPGDVNALVKALGDFKTAHDKLADAVQQQGNVGQAHPYPDPPQGCIK